MQFSQMPAESVVFGTRPKAFVFRVKKCVRKHPLKQSVMHHAAYYLPVYLCNIKQTPVNDYKKQPI